MIKFKKMEESKKSDYNSAIQIRYSAQAKKENNLSCGDALSYACVHKGDVVVDIGSGKGKAVLKAAKSAAYVYGIDLTGAMIEAAKKVLEEEGIANAEFICSSMDSIALSDGMADVIISNCAINHAADKHKVYSEIYRILKPEGRFIVSDIIAENEVPDHIANDPQAVAGCYGGAIPVDKYFTAIHRSGFSSIEVLQESAPYEKNGILIRGITLRGYKN
ncbi:MAG: methyltransferase domain-containing protein [Spirochaetia bacterium]|nr:methyltransferase domain-containing protein [Spirochaetia bacterium]